MCTQNSPQHLRSATVHTDGKNERSGSQTEAKPVSAKRMNMMKRALYTLALAVGTLFTTAAAHAQVGVAREQPQW